MQCELVPHADRAPSSALIASTLAEPTPGVAQLQGAVGRLQAELIAAQRVMLLGSLSAMVLHEIKNLLTPILGRAEFALSTGLPADMRTALERSRTLSQRVIVVTERLLGFAQAAPIRFEACSVAHAAREAIDAVTRPLDKDKIELSVSIPDELTVRADRPMLEQILLNLLLNARAAMKGIAGTLRISAARQGEHIVIDVCDSGCGIPPERIRTVVNPFLAGDPLSDTTGAQSVGLGLSVCRLIARQHGATIEASANSGRGCTFRLRWPAAQEGRQRGDA